MTFLLVQAMLANPLACVCFWLMGLVLGSLIRWWRCPPLWALARSASQAAAAPVEGAPHATFGIAHPSSSTIADDATQDLTLDPAGGQPRSLQHTTTPLHVHTPEHTAHQPGPHHASLPAPRHPWYVHEREARDVLSRVAAQDEGEEKGWSHMMDKQVQDKFTYSGYRRSLPNGLTEYRTVTTFADTTPIELMEFLLDDEARRGWEGFLSCVEVLLSGDWLGGREQIVRWVRRFPFAFLSDREYVMARKAWVVKNEGDGNGVQLLPLTCITPGATLVAATKSLDNHPDALPPTSSVVRTMKFNSNWICRAVPDPFGSGHCAAQVVLLHSEDIRIAEYLARTAVSLGMGKFVKDLTGGLETFKEARRAAGVPPHSLDLSAYGHDFISDVAATETGQDTGSHHTAAKVGMGSGEEQMANGRIAVVKAEDALGHGVAGVPTTHGGSEEGTWLVGAGRDVNGAVQSADGTWKAPGTLAGQAASPIRVSSPGASSGASPTSQRSPAATWNGQTFSPAVNASAYSTSWNGQQGVGGGPSQMVGGEWRRRSIIPAAGAPLKRADSGKGGKRPWWQKAMITVAVAGVFVLAKKARDNAGRRAIQGKMMPLRRLLAESQQDAPRLPSGRGAKAHPIDDEEVVDVSE